MDCPISRAALRSRFRSRSRSTRRGTRHEAQGVERSPRSGVLRSPWSQVPAPRFHSTVWPSRRQDAERPGAPWTEDASRNDLPQNDLPLNPDVPWTDAGCQEAWSGATGLDTPVEAPDSSGNETPALYQGDLFGGATVPVEMIPSAAPDEETEEATSDEMMLEPVRDEPDQLQLFPHPRGGSPATSPGSCSPQARLIMRSREAVTSCLREGLFFFGAAGLVALAWFGV